MAQWISARLPPLRPVFDSRTQRLMWVEVGVGLVLILLREGFSLGSRFSSLHKTTLLNSNSIWTLIRTTSLLARGCYSLPCLNKVKSLFLVAMEYFMRWTPPTDLSMQHKNSETSLQAAGLRTQQQPEISTIRWHTRQNSPDDEATYGEDQGREQ